MNNLKISIALVTYNHEKFIKEALGSISEQTISAPLEIVIGNDGSNDQTTNIINDWIKKAPSHWDIKHNIRSRNDVHRNSYNSSSLYNILTTLSECNGDVISYLEGDDKWTDPQKLEIQLDLLLNNPDVSLCIHNSQIDSYDENGQIHSSRNAFSQKELLREIEVTTWPRESIATSSMMFRSTILNILLKKEFRDSYVFDAPLFFIAQSQGKILRSNKLMSCYREHHQGVWSGAAAADKYYGLYQVLILISRFVEYKHANYTYWSQELAAYNLICFFGRVSYNSDKVCFDEQLEMNLGDFAWITQTAIENINKLHSQVRAIETSRSYQVVKKVRSLIHVIKKIIFPKN